ncbi:hypothetical protein MF406_06160 [Georgenia sp. TF02-10]|uniref:hypothetical protein n=1 Tax=Georgenia sp. TF02-10 TaxID=2917725 RepID=UPI001FA80E17|nr:hypothetical protein [Georgenia sp. TF02-10]UNX55817.1 hypothetical protein MF406_06160 [Georgenia sp. TF02-10]
MALLVRLDLRFRAGATGALLLCLLVGVLVGGDMLHALVTDAWIIPFTFTRGLVSPAVWTALGVAGTLTGIAARRARQEESVGHRAPSRKSGI